MKKLLFFTLYITMCIYGFSQTMEPEIVRMGKGKIIMLDGTTLEGEVQFSHTNQTRLTLWANEEAQKIKTKEVKEFEIEGSRYVRISSGALSMGSDEVFAKCLTPENFKISIYEHISQGIVGSGGLFKTDRAYFVKFPSEEKARDFGDVTLIPFNKKVSKLVEDCPALSKKILDKEKNYKLGVITTPEIQLDVYMRIANEYQQCN